MEKVFITSLFEITGAKWVDRMRVVEAGVNDVDAVPFVTRSGLNNGVGGYVEPRPALLNTGKVITVALDGSTGATFYQHHDFMSGQNIWILSPLSSAFASFSPEVALYFVASIQRAVSAYSYNLSLTKSRLLKVKIQAPPRTPEGTVDCDSITLRIRKMRGAHNLQQAEAERYQTL